MQKKSTVEKSKSSFLCSSPFSPFPLRPQSAVPLPSPPPPLLSPWGLVYQYKQNYPIEKRREKWGGGGKCGPRREGKGDDGMGVINTTGYTSWEGAEQHTRRHSGGTSYGRKILPPPRIRSTVSPLGTGDGGRTDRPSHRSLFLPPFSPFFSMQQEEILHPPSPIPSSNPPSLPFTFLTPHTPRLLGLGRRAEGARAEEGEFADPNPMHLRQHAYADKGPKLLFQ